jgi:peptide/nickel transport system substrate-binding protein
MAARRRPFRRSIVVLVAALALVTAACSSSHHASASTTTTPNGATTSTNAGSAGSPKRGGQLTFATLFLSPTLDPIKNPGGGAEGGEIMHAVYGNLIEVNSNTGQQIAGGMAKSLTSDSTFQTWTMTLRGPSVVFTDGEPFNAAAVVKNIQRFTNAKLNATAQTNAALISSMDTPDSTTIVFHLSQPYAGFAGEFSGSLGFVAAPLVLDKWDAGAATTPAVGAGPFSLVSLNPNEAVVVTANAKYWAGPPYLDGVKFVSVPTASGTFQAFQTGQFQIAYIYDPTVYKQVVSQKIPYYALPQFGTIGTMFNGRTGQVFNDLRLRQAVAMATDPQVVNTRVWNGGLAIVGNQFVAPESHWYTPANKSIPLNTAAAKQLVDQVKSANPAFKGDVTYSCYTGAGAQGPQMGLVMKALLAPIGLNVSLATSPDVNTFVQTIVVNHDFQMACWGGWNFSDYSPLRPLQSSFYSTSPGNLSAIGSPAMDAALNALRVAATPDAIKSALTAFNNEFQTNLPGVISGATYTFALPAKSVQNLTFFGTNLPALENVWLS